MPEDGKKVAAGLGIVGLVAGGIYLLTRKAEAKPPPPPPGLANLYGKVIDYHSDQPIPGVMVVIGDASIFTDTQGNYAHLNLIPDSYQVGFTKEGYWGKAVSITLSEGNNELNVQLVSESEPEPPPEPPPEDEITLLEVQFPDTVERLPSSGVTVPFFTSFRIHVPYMEPGTYSYTVYKVEVIIKARDWQVQMGKMPAGWWRRVAIGPWAQGAPDTQYVYKEYNEIDEYAVEASARLSSMEFRLPFPYLPYPLDVTLEVTAWDGLGDTEYYRGVVLSASIGTIMVLS